MSKHLRPSRSASFRAVALASLLGASLVGAVGCVGGSNPFCGNSKEKCEINESLERAQEVDANEADKADDAKTDEPIDPRPASVLPTDGSGNATAIAADSNATKRKTFADDASPQKMLETASTSDVVPNELNAATISAPEEKSDSDVEDPLLAAPPLPSNPPAPPADVENPTSEPAAEPEQADAPADAASEEPSADESEAPKAEPEPTVARSTRKTGPQRASRRVAQRGSAQTLAVPQTRGVANVPVESAPEPPSVVKTRVRAVVF